jgi:hypothetical protein
MSRLLGIHEVPLADGVDAVEFERLFTEAAALTVLDGWKTRLLKGDRGERTGKYAIFYEIESPEARDRYFPAKDQMSEEAERYMAERPAVAELWQRLDAYQTGNEVTTDYLVVVE